MVRGVGGCSILKGRMVILFFTNIKLHLSLIKLRNGDIDKISEFGWVNNQFLSLDWEISKLQSYDGHIYKFLKIMFHELDNIYMRGLFNFNSIYKYTF